MSYSSLPGYRLQQHKLKTWLIGDARDTYTLLSRIPIRSMSLDISRSTLTEWTNHHFQKEESTRAAGNKIFQQFSLPKRNTVLQKKPLHGKDKRLSFSVFGVLPIQDTAYFQHHKSVNFQGSNLCCFKAEVNCPCGFMQKTLQQRCKKYKVDF